MACDILVFGTGSLARSFCLTIAVAAERPLTIGVVGRSRDSVNEVVTIANARSATRSCDVEFSGGTVDWENPDDLRETLERFAPRLIFQTATLQSPWTIADRDTAWTRMIKDGGFGVTLPLQAMLLTQVARELKRSNARTTLVNACYPDAVNPIIHHLGLPITCGIGNVGILSAVCRGNDRSETRNTWRIVAHHWHLTRLRRDDRAAGHMPWVWRDGQRVEDVPEVFAGLSGVRGQRLNHVTGCHAVEVVLALLAPEPRMIHVPGPNGLPGGYPVMAGEGRVALALPEDLSIAEAVEFNSHTASEEGTAAIDSDGFVAFSEKASMAIKEHAVTLAEGFSVNDLDTAVDEFLRLRTSLDRS
jgi:hypothetical protein